MVSLSGHPGRKIYPGQARITWSGYNPSVSSPSGQECRRAPPLIHRETDTIWPIGPRVPSGPSGNACHRARRGLVVRRLGGVAGGGAWRRRRVAGVAGSGGGGVGGGGGGGGGGEKPTAGGGE